MISISAWQDCSTLLDEVRLRLAAYHKQMPLAIRSLIAIAYPKAGVKDAEQFQAPKANSMTAASAGLHLMCAASPNGAWMTWLSRQNSRLPKIDNNRRLVKVKKQSMNNFCKVASSISIQQPALLQRFWKYYQSTNRLHAQVFQNLMVCGHKCYKARRRLQKFERNSWP